MVKINSRQISKRPLIYCDIDHATKVRHARQIISRKLYNTGSEGSGVLQMLQYGKKNVKTFAYLKDSSGAVFGYAYVEYFRATHPSVGCLGVFIHPLMRDMGYGRTVLECLKQAMYDLRIPPMRLAVDERALYLFKKIFAGTAHTLEAFR